MSLSIEDFGWNVIITGFRNVHIENPEDFIESIRRGSTLDTEIQFFDARYIATAQHLYFAALNAVMAFDNRENLSKSLAMESLLFASAQRQIRKAMEKIGIQKGTKNLAVLIIGKKENSIEQALLKIARQIGLKPDASVLALSEEKFRKIKKIFAISDQELETAERDNDSSGALVDLVIERVALLSTKR